MSINNSYGDDWGDSPQLSNSDLDQIIGLDNYILDPDAIESMDFTQGKYIMICAADGNPAMFEVNGRKFIFMYDGMTSDETIFYYADRLHQGGFQGSLSIQGVHGPNVKEALKYYAGEAGTVLLLNAPLGNNTRVQFSVDQE